MDNNTLTDINGACPNSKFEIKADIYHKNKQFAIEDGFNQNLSRVDSDNYPDTANNLDNLAQKMGFNQQTNTSTPKKTEINKLDRCSEENLCEKGISKSFQVAASEKQYEPIPNKVPIKKSGFMTNIIRRLSISTPKIFSKNKKHPKPSNKKHSNHKECNDNQKLPINGNVDIIGVDKSINMNILPNGVDDKNSQFNSPRSKSIRKILQKLAKRKNKSKITSEPPSSIESRPSLSSVANHGLNFESTTSCNDIFLNKLCKNELQKYNCSSADCILDYHKHENLIKNQESVSSTSEDMKEHEAKLNAEPIHIPNETFSDEFPDIEISTTKIEKDNISPLSIKTTDFNFDTQRSCHSTMSGGYLLVNKETSSKVKLTLALYGYGNYGLSSSRLTSKSCMEFRSATLDNKIRSSVEKIICNEGETNEEKLKESDECHASEEFKIESTNNEKIESANNEKIESTNNEKIESTNNETIESTNDTTEHSNEVCENNVAVRETSENSEQSVVLRKSQRPNDIKIRRSREPSQNMAARSSMIMLVVSHNSPRSKIISNQLSTPNKDVDLNSSFNGSNQNGIHIPAMKLNFDNLSANDHKNNQDETTTIEDVIKSMNFSPNVDGNSLEKCVSENGFFVQSTEVLDGHHYLKLVHKNEKEIQIKIDVVQKYLDNSDLVFDDDVSGQLLVTVGKAKLLVAEKMVQFKGLCEKNISGIIEENELPTLSSDLNGFWDMVYGQIEDINKNFVLVEKIKSNDWKMIPYEIEEKFTPTRSKRSTTSKPLVVGQSRKSSNTNTPVKKKTTVDTPLTSKISVDKRKNMMQFKLNLKASMAQQTGDVTFYS